MSNLFFRTSVAPYRIDTYNAMHDLWGYEFYFLDKEDTSQPFDMQRLYDECHFQPHFLKTFSVLKRRFKVCTKLRSILKKHNPEVVIVPEYKLLTLQVLLLRKLIRKRFKVVSMCDDSYDMVANHNDFSRVHGWARNLIAPRLDDLLLVDSKVVEWYQQKFSKGIWLPIIRDDVKELEAYRRVLPISQRFADQYDLWGKKILLSVSRLVALKNLERTIQAVNRCKEDFVFVIVGSGEEEAHLQQVAKDCSHRILFVGQQFGDEVRAWYNLASVFILASTQEAYGAVTNEALLAGCRCVVSSHCGSNCLIDKTNGSEINPMDECDITAKIDHEMQLSEQIPSQSDLLKSRNSLMNFTFKETVVRVFEQISTRKNNQ